MMLSMSVLFYIANTGKINFSTNRTTTNGHWATTNVVFTVGSWHHIAITYDGSSTSNNPIIYVNGESVAVTRAVAPNGTHQITGTSIIGASGGLTYSFPGFLDEFALWDKILTAVHTRVS